MLGNRAAKGDLKDAEMENRDVVCCVVSRGVACNLERIRVTGVKLSENVSQLKQEIAKRIDIPVKDYIVIFHGKCLNETDTLESNGIKYGMTLHLMPKVEQHQPAVSAVGERSEIGLEHLAVALRASMRAPSFRTAFQMFTKANVFENIVASAPGLAHDPVAIACLLDADLLAQFTDLATLQRASERHPALVEAISHIVANVLDPSTHAGPSGLGDTSVPLNYSYLLDPSDEEDVDSSSQAASASTLQSADNSAAASSSFSAITPAQLASALAAVATSTPLAHMPTSSFTPDLASTSNVSLTTPLAAAAADTAGASAAGQLITSELFSQAIQQAMNASTQSQIQQLRAMGITNDNVSLRALQITGGDVQAALELIFDLQQNDGQRS